MRSVFAVGRRLDRVADLRHRPTAAGAPWGYFGLGAAPSPTALSHHRPGRVVGAVHHGGRLLDTRPALPATRTLPAQAALARAYPGRAPKPNWNAAWTTATGRSTAGRAAQLVEEVAALAPSWKDAPPDPDIVGVRRWKGSGRVAIVYFYI